MTHVYTFHIELVGFEKTLWRDMEVSDNYTVAQLGYANMASYGGEACHLFNIRYKGKRYELLFGPDEFEEELGSAINPMTVKLKELGLAIGDTMTMEYDYGAGWEWTMMLIDVRQMPKGTGKHYPFVTKGAGHGIIEDTSPYELQDIINRIDETNEPIKIMDYEFGRPIKWDYRVCYPIEYACLFKDNVQTIQEAYEMPFYE